MPSAKCRALADAAGFRRTTRGQPFNQRVAVIRPVVHFVQASQTRACQCVTGVQALPATIAASSSKWPACLLPPGDAGAGVARLQLDQAASINDQLPRAVAEEKPNLQSGVG